MVEITDMKENFRNLGGTTNAQHMHNFNKFTKQLISLLNEDEQKTLVNQLEATNRQEELFLTKLILKVNCKEKALEILMGGDRILAYLATKHSPFILDDIPVAYFLDTICPNVSWVIRNRIINTFSKRIRENSRGEQLFLGVLEKYGIATAHPLLITCGEQFLKNALTNFNIQFSQPQLVRLYQRYSHGIIEFYYNERKKYDSGLLFSDHQCLAQYLVINDIKAFFALLKFGIPKVGKRGFLNFFENYKREIIMDPQKYRTLVKEKLLFRKLNEEEFIQYLVNRMPANFDTMKIISVFNDILKIIPCKLRCSLVSKCLQQKYSYSVWDKDEYVVRRLIEMSPLADKLKFTSQKDKFELMPPSEAFPKIRQQINITSDINNRISLVMQMFMCAELHKDINALEEALKYVCERHKNDHNSLRQEVFEHVTERWNVQELTPTCWKYVQEMRISEEIIDDNAYYLSGILEAQITYLFINGQDFKPLLKHYTKYNGPHGFRISFDNKSLNKEALLLYPQFIKELYTKEDDLKAAHDSYIRLLIDWNRKNRKDKISFYQYPDIIDTIVKDFNDGPYYSNLLEILKCIPNNKVEMQKHYEIVNKFKGFVHLDNIMRWYLKHYPEQIAKNLPELFSEKATCNSKFYYEIAKMHYNADLMKINEMAHKYLKESNNTDVILKSLTILSFRKDFLQIILENCERFLPPADGILNLYEENIQDKVKIQERILECFKNRTKPAEIIECLLKFCYKDYFQRALSPLSYAMFNIAENQLQKPINELKSRSVTIRKRATYFATHLGTAEFSMRHLSEVGELEKNQSLQKFIVSQTFKAFCNIQNKESFQLLLKHFILIPKNDTETLGLLYGFSKIPRTFIGTYIENVWKAVGETMDHQKCKPLRTITRDVLPLLSDKFCDDLIHYTSEKDAEACYNEIVDFIFMYLIFSGDKIDHRFKLLINATNSWEDTTNFEETLKQNRKKWTLFIDICWKLIQDKEGEFKEEKKILIEKLVNHSEELPLPYNKFEFLLTIQMIKCHLFDSKLPSFLINQQNQYCDKFGAIILSYLQDFFRNTMTRIIESMDVDHTEYRLNFVEEMLQIDSSEVTILLALQLLPSSYPVGEIQSRRLRKVIEKIQCDATPSILIYLNQYLKETLDF